MTGSSWLIKEILIISFADTAHKLIYHQLSKIQQIYAMNVILFQIKVNATNIKESTLTRYFIKVTARPSFTQLRVIKRIDRVH